MLGYTKIICEPVVRLTACATSEVLMAIRPLGNSAGKCECNSSLRPTALI